MAQRGPNGSVHEFQSTTEVALELGLGLGLDITIPANEGLSSICQD